MRDDAKAVLLAREAPTVAAHRVSRADNTPRTNVEGRLDPVA